MELESGFEKFEKADTAAEQRGSAPTHRVTQRRCSGAVRDTPPGAVCDTATQRGSGRHSEAVHDTATHRHTAWEKRMGMPPFCSNEAQARIYTLIKLNGVIAMPRHELAKLCGTTKSSLDRALRKFGFQGLVTYSTHNSAMGNRGTVITWTGGESQGDTATQRVTQRHSDTPGDTAMRCVTHRPPLLERKKEDLSLSLGGEIEEESPRVKLLALTEEDFRTFWPSLSNLPKGGFGVKQIRQLVNKLSKVDMPLDGVMQGLHHAEFAVKNGLAKDKTGKQIQGAGYFFNALLADGYYDRPPGYLSPREKALKEREDELKREREAAARIEEVAFQSWVGALSDEEKAEILAANHMPGPERAKMLKAYRERKT